MTNPDGSLKNMHQLYNVTAIFIWATTCDFQQCGILTSVGSDEPVEPPFKFYKLQMMSSQ